MNIELFSNEDEGTNFLNYKAKSRIQNLESVCKENEKDILEYISNCSSIFQKYNKKNLIEEIYNIDKELKAIDSETIDDNKINEFKSKREIVTFEFKQFIEELQSLYNNENLDLSLKAKYLSDREDIEFAYKKIFNRSLDIHDKKTLISDIETSYPDARDFNINEFKQNSITFKMINDYLNINESPIIETEEPNLEVINDEIFDDDLYVVKISEAPDNLKIEDKSKNEIAENNDTNTMENDTSFFGIDDSLTESILNNETPSFDEVEEVETTPLEDIPLDVELVPNEENIEINNENMEEPAEVNNNEIKVEDTNTPEETETNEEIAPVNNEVVVQEEHQEELNSEQTEPNSDDKQVQDETTSKEQNNPENESSNEMTYTMDSNDTLYNIALALFQDDTLAKKAADKIIENNKAAIEQRLSEKNVTNNENIINMTDIFTGVTLNLANLFDEVVENGK